MRKVILYSLVIVCITSCKKEEVPEVNPPISNIPVIEFISVTPTTVTEYTDSLIFEISYLDGNGDLGSANPDINSLFLIDTRIFTVQEYHIPLLAPEGADIAIQGKLIIHLENTILINPEAESETVQFKIQIVDRAGNFSNYVNSPDIMVLPYPD